MQEAYNSSIQELKNVIKDNRFPDDIDDLNIPAKLTKIFNYHINKQHQLKAQFLTETESIRQKYRKSLHINAQKSKTKGLKTNLREIEQEIENTTTGGSDFIEYILKF